MKKLLARINKALLIRFGFRMYVQGGDWDGVSHYTWTVDEALEWMACYPANVQKFVFAPNGRDVLCYHWSYRRDQAC